LASMQMHMDLTEKEGGSPEKSRGRPVSRPTLCAVHGSRNARSSAFGQWFVSPVMLAVVRVDCSDVVVLPPHPARAMTATDEANVAFRIIENEKLQRSVGGEVG
jgi:hypothetical protein